MFEALMVPLFVPEEVWAPRSWGLNHPLYTRAHIEHGLQTAGFGFWGFSPAARPRGGYQVYGVKALASSKLGYFCHDIDPAVGPVSAPHSSRVAHGVVTPHASFLALRYAPHEAVANLRALTQKFPMIYGPLGFQDSVDVTAGVVSPCILTLDQGMIMAAIANELAEDAMRHAFSDGLIEQNVRPLIAIEGFDVGAPAEGLAARAADHNPPARKRGFKRRQRHTEQVRRLPQTAHRPLNAARSEPRCQGHRQPSQSRFGCRRRNADGRRARHGCC